MPSHVHVLVECRKYSYTWGFHELAVSKQYTQEDIMIDLTCGMGYPTSLLHRLVIENECRENELILKHYKNYIQQSPLDKSLPAIKRHLGGCAVDFLYWRWPTGLFVEMEFSGSYYHKAGHYEQYMLVSGSVFFVQLSLVIICI